MYITIDRLGRDDESNLGLSNNILLMIGNCYLFKNNFSSYKYKCAYSLKKMSNKREKILQKLDKLIAGSSDSEHESGHGSEHESGHGSEHESGHGSEHESGHGSEHDDPIINDSVHYRDNEQEYDNSDVDNSDVDSIIVEDKNTNPTNTQMNYIEYDNDTIDRMEKNSKIGGDVYASDSDTSSTTNSTQLSSSVDELSESNENNSEQKDVDSEDDVEFSAVVDKNSIVGGVEQSNKTINLIDKLKKIHKIFESKIALK
jgi:hypothetical protein